VKGLFNAISIAVGVINQLEKLEEAIAIDGGVLLFNSLFFSLRFLSIPR